MCPHFFITVHYCVDRFKIGFKLAFIYLNIFGLGLQKPFHTTVIVRSISNSHNINANLTLHIFLPNITKYCATSIINDLPLYGLLADEQGSIFSKILTLKLTLILRIFLRLKCNSKKKSKKVCEEGPSARFENYKVTLDLSRRKVSQLSFS